MYFAQRENERSPAQRFEELVGATIAYNDQLTEKVVGLPDMSIEVLAENLSATEIFRLQVEHTEQSMRRQSYHLPRIKEKAQEGQDIFLERYGDLWGVAQGMETPIINILNSDRAEEFAEWLLGKHEFIQNALTTIYLLETGKIDYLLTFPWHELHPAAPTVEDKMFNHKAVGGHLLWLATQQGLAELAVRDCMASEHDFDAVFPTKDPDTGQASVSVLNQIERRGSQSVLERWSAYYVRDGHLFREIFQSECDFSKEVEPTYSVIIDTPGSRSHHIIHLLETMLAVYVDFDQMDIDTLRAHVRSSLDQEDDETR